MEAGGEMEGGSKADREGIVVITFSKYRVYRISKKVTKSIIF